CWWLGTGCWWLVAGCWVRSAGRSGQSAGCRVDGAKCRLVVNTEVCELGGVIEACPDDVPVREQLRRFGKVLHDTARVAGTDRPTGYRASCLQLGTLAEHLRVIAGAQLVPFGIGDTRFAVRRLVLVGGSNRMLVAPLHLLEELQRVRVNFVTLRNDDPRRVCAAQIVEGRRRPFPARDFACSN